jgi:anti-sigma factor ChrR (cupin superfamily)
MPILTENILSPGDRVVIDTGEVGFKPYDRYGTPNPTMDWIPLSGNANDGFETFLLKMKPGAQSTPHQHTQREEFLILEGTITDCDGETFSSGQYVKFKPGSTHYSRSEDGCTMLVVLTGQNKKIEQITGGL